MTFYSVNSLKYTVYSVYINFSKVSLEEELK